MNRVERLLRVDKLSVRYAAARGDVLAVDEISFALGRGEAVGVVGESGSGKSTIAQAVLGLLDRDSSTVAGEIEFDGEQVLAYDEHQWRTLRGRRIGMMFQSPESSFSPTATIGAQISEALRCHFKLGRAEARVRALDALRRVDMPRPEEVMHNYAFELSGGMCQRAALALVMALQPTLVLADEPTASLDLLAQAELVRWLGSMQKQNGFGMLIISHDLNMIARLADRVLVMYAGRVVESGPTPQVLAQPRHPYTQQLLTAVPTLHARPRPMSPRAQSIIDEPRLSRGCAFAPRCDRVIDRCYLDPAPVLDGSGVSDVFVACHRARDVGAA